MPFFGTYNAAGNSGGWLVSMTDSLTTPTLNWGQWLGGINKTVIRTLSRNNSTIYVGGDSTGSNSWEAFKWLGTFHALVSNAFVVSLTDSGTTPSLNWGQWIGGIRTTSIMASSNNSSTIYVGGFSAGSNSWAAIPFGSLFIPSNPTEGFVVSLTDSGGTTPTLNWGQWLGGQTSVIVAITNEGTNVYAGGYSASSFSWNTIALMGTFNSSVSGSNGFVVSIADGGTNSTFNWGQWLGGNSNDQVVAISNNGPLIYVGGWSADSTSWETVNFFGHFIASATSEGFVTKIDDTPTPYPEPSQTVIGNATIGNATVG